jgi:TetR/AcrR family transcriptional regulator, transcriptional repressor for nem operon
MVRKKASRSARRPRRRIRDKDETRARLLAAGFEEVYTRGFQGASVDRILERLEVTKGAFFHHFPSKTAFGYALVEETIAGMIRAQWVDALSAADDPLTAIADAFDRGVRALEAAPLNLGCPLNNLAQEMSPLDGGFRIRTQQVFELWMQTFELALRRGQAGGAVSTSIDPRAAAFALVAEIEGILSLSRNSQDRRVLALGSRNLRRHLDAMRPPPASSS